MTGLIRKIGNIKVATHPAWMEVDLDALASNYYKIRQMVGLKMKIIASVKGDAYGVGIVEAARVLEKLGAYAIATGSFKDALAVREAGVEIKIHMFPGNLPEGIGELLRHDLIPTVYNLETAHAVSGSATQPTPIFIKVDAGLGRLGVFLADAKEFVKKVASLPNIIIEGLYTHLPFSNAEQREWALPRLKQFDELVIDLDNDGYKIPVVQSIASSGVVCGTENNCNTVCTGHLLFGGMARVTPDLADISGFHPVIAAIRTRLIHLTQYDVDTKIGSGGHQLVPSGGTTGVVPIGLYDGYWPAKAGAQAMMLIRGNRVPVLNVSQEYTVLDFTKITTHQLGEEVVVLGSSEGERITMEELAGWLGVSPLYLHMSFNKRFPTVYLDIDA